jgi:Holliday junction resolvase
MNSKRKGTGGEHELVNLLQGYGIRAYRNDQIFKGGKGNPDVEAEIAGTPIHFEVKRVEKLNVPEAVAQAVRDAAADHFPAVAHRRNREKWLLTVPLVPFLDLLKGKGAFEPDPFLQDLIMEQTEQQ